MPVNIRRRHFLKLIDYTPAEIRYLLDLSHNFKDLKRAGTPHRYLEGKNVVLLFEKTSTRTRCAFEVAGRDLGMGVTYLDPGSSQMGKKESIADTAKVLGRMYDGIEYRGFSQKIVEELAANAGVPVWNGLTDEFHPTQMLADLLTIEEKKGKLKGLKFTYFGDARNNMGNSLMIACAKMGLHFTALRAEGAVPGAGAGGACKAVCRGKRRLRDAHGGYHGRRSGRGRSVYRHLGFHGRAGLRVGRAYPAAESLSGQCGKNGAGKAGRNFHALPALVP